MKAFHGLGSYHSHTICKYKMHWDKDGVEEENQGCCCVGRRKNNGTSRWLEASILLPSTALLTASWGMTTY